MRVLCLLLFACTALTGTTLTYSASVEQVLSCEAKSVAGDHDALQVKDFDTTYPSIRLNRDDKSLMFVYVKNGRKWERDDEILIDEFPFIVGVRKFESDWVSIIHRNTEKKHFTSLFSGETGNTMTYGRCY